MDNKLWKEAVETEYDVMNDETTERLKDVAVIDASLKNSSFAETDKYGLTAYDSDSYICEISAYRTYKGKECPKDTPVFFNIRFYTTFISDEEEYNKLIILVDGKRVELPAQNKVYKLEKYDAYWITEWLTQKHIINGLTDGPKKLNSHNTGCERSILTVLTPDIVTLFAAAEGKMSLYIDKETIINIKGGDIKFTESGGSFHIEGLIGFMKRVCHFFVDETSYTDYCNSYYENKKELAKKTAQKKAQKEAKEEKEEQEAIKQAIKLRNIWLIVLIVSIVYFVLAISLEWDNFGLIIAIIMGIISTYKIGRW